MSNEPLSDDEIARIDVLAAARGVTRDDMIAELAARGHGSVPAHVAAHRRAAPKARIRVEVARGTSPSERWVMFTAEGKTHALIVDAGDVAGELLSVTVVREEGDQILIELPRAAIAGKRVKVPADSVLEEPPSGRLGWALLGFVVLVATGGAWLLLRALE